MRYLLDTNTCIFIIKCRPTIVRQRLEKVAVGDVGVSTVTISELEFGVAKSSRPDQNRIALEKFLLPLEILSYDRKAAARYGDLRCHLESCGTPIGSMDLMIAAHALAAGWIVVTNNTREFSRVPGLITEDWTFFDSESADHPS